MFGFHPPLHASQIACKCTFEDTAQVHYIEGVPLQSVSQFVVTRVYVLLGLAFFSFVGWDYPERADAFVSFFLGHTHLIDLVLCVLWALSPRKSV